MKFGPVAADVAEGAVLAHSLRVGKARLAKGRVLTGDDVATLKGAGIARVVAARLEAGDAGEDEAAAWLAGFLVAPGIIRAGAPATGRVNLFAACNGLFRAWKDLVDAFNRVDPAITLATLADRSAVVAGDLIATLKIIPLAVPGATLERVRARLGSGRAIEIKPFRSVRAGLIATCLPSLKPSVMDKTARLLADRLRSSASEIVAERRIAHTAEAVGDALSSLVADCDLVVLFGASAIVDPGDVVPAGIVHAGGVVDHVGMPVDPGNLLVLGHVGDTPVIGAPGCARGPQENGFDRVLARILAGETPAPEAIMAMGVGGLLKETPSRPQPRVGQAPAPQAGGPVEIVLLAAGRSSRMGPGDEDKTAPHKLLATFGGVPLVRRSCERALASRAGAVHAVIGHRGREIRAALAGLGLHIVENPDYDEGMAASLRSGIAEVGPHATGALILPADMPGLTGDHLNALIGAFERAPGRTVVRAVSGAAPGNPVILPRELFDLVMQLQGDAGARRAIEDSGAAIVNVEIGEAALLDVDTREAVIGAGGVPER